MISTNSSASQWVRKELAIADASPLSIVPIRLGNCRVPAVIRHLPYVAFRSDDLPYGASLKLLSEMLDRSVVVHPWIKLSKFSVWGGCSVRAVDDYGCEISIGAKARGACGLCLEEPLFIQGAKSLVFDIEGSERCDFTGWNPKFPRMLKVELNENPLRVRQRHCRSTDDPTYIVGGDGTFEFGIPHRIREDGYVKKVNIVFGKGRISKLRVHLRVA